MYRVPSRRCGVVRDDTEPAFPLFLIGHCPLVPLLSLILVLFHSIPSLPVQEAPAIVESQFDERLVGCTGGIGGE